MHIHKKIIKFRENCPIYLCISKKSSNFVVGFSKIRISRVPENFNFWGERRQESL